MKTVGIIVEWNPMHNGHFYHISEARKRSNADVVIAVMSSNFVQRGEPAIYSKFVRTKMALKNQVDLIIELPFYYSVQSANNFSYAAVSLLEDLGVDELYFGSEIEDINILHKLNDVLESDEYQVKLKEYLNLGYSYPTSSDNALKAVSNIEGYDYPNVILGLQYLQSIKQLSSNIKPFIIKRVSTNYYDPITEGTVYQSATSIRKEILKGSDISKFVPSGVLELVLSNKPVVLNDFSDYLKQTIYTSTKENLNSIFLVDEGFGNSLLKIKQFTKVDDLIDQIISKRYTNAKVKRMLTHILLNNTLTLDKRPSYIRILGMNDVGRLYLNKIKKQLRIPLITKVKHNINDCLDLELRASKLYSSIHNDETFELEFKSPIIEYID